MKSTSEPAFTVVDRRGQNHSEETEKVSEAVPPEKSATRSWKDVTYVLAIAQGGPGVLLHVGRAVGQRSDDKSFAAEYLIFPVQTENTFDWRPHAKKRLDTFLNCDCDLAHGTCPVHKLSLQQWPQQDQERYHRMAMKPVPKALEMLHLAEQAARQKPQILIPR